MSCSIRKCTLSVSIKTIISNHLDDKNKFILICRFKDKAIYGYGTSIPPYNNEDEMNEMSPRKVIFCIHGKLAGCCMLKGSTTDESPTTDNYQQNSISKFY